MGVNLTPTAERQLVVTLTGASLANPIKFAQKSGGDISSDNVKVWSGGSLVPDVLAGPATVDNVTLTKSFDLSTEVPIVAAFRAAVGNGYYNVSVQVYDGTLTIPQGDPLLYNNALLVGMTELTADASSGNAATYALQLAIPTVG